MRNPRLHKRSTKLAGRFSKVMSLIVLVGMLAVLGAMDEAGAKKLRLAYIPAADILSYFVAKDRGFFKQEGLDVEGKIIGGGAVQMPAIEGGSIDVGISAPMSLTNAHTKGFDMQFIAPGAFVVTPGHSGFVWTARSNDTSINSIKDLIGKTVAINLIGSVSYLGLRYQLAKAGISYKKVNIVEVPFPQMTVPIEQGRVDVAGQVEPFVTVMLNKKKSGKEISRGNFGGLLASRYMIGGWFMKKSWINKNKDTARAFVRAISASHRYIAAHPDEVPKLIAANTRMKESMVNEIVLSAYGEILLPSDLQPIINAAAELKLIPKRFPASEIISEIAAK